MTTEEPRSQPDPPPVPADLGQVTAGWLERALRAGGLAGVEVASIAVEPLGAAGGLLGDLARVRVAYARGQGPATVMVKVPPADPGGHQVGSMLRAWAREGAFYREVAPASPGARVPHCYHNGADEEAGRWVLVLEDCGPGERPTGPGAGASPAQAEAAVDALAAFHATWWGSPRRFAWMPGFDSAGVGGLQPLWFSSHPRFLERFGHLIPEPTAAWLVDFSHRLPAWSARAAAEALTVVHADYRLDNLLYIGRQVTIIDWQTALRGPGAMDLSSFLATSLTVGDRRAAENDLIERYRRGLADRGVSVDAAWLARSYDETLLWWMGQFANNLARLEPADPAVQQTLDTMIERTFTAAADRDAGRLIPDLD